MGLIQKNTRPAEMTKVQKQDRMRQRISRMTSNIYTTMTNQHAQMFKLVFQNPLGLTPQEVVDSLGTDAGEAFTFSVLAQDLLEQIDPEYVRVESPVPYTINPNGTVTLG